MKALIAIVILVLIIMIFGIIYIRGYIITEDDTNIIIISTVSSLTAIVGLLITIFIFSLDIHKNNLEKKKRINALKFELKVNINNAGVILETVEKENIPETRYEISIIQKMFESGEIPQINQIDFWNVYIEMKYSNRILEKAILIQFYEHIASTNDSRSRSGRREKIKELLGWINGKKELKRQMEILLNKI